MELRIVQGLVGAVVLGALVLFTAFPQFKPDWIQIGNGRDGRGQTPFRRASFGGDAAEDHIDLAAAHILAERWDKATTELTEALRLEPNHAEALYLRGIAWQSQEEFAKAVSDFSAVLKITPDDADAFYARATSRTELGQIAEAIADLDAMLRIESDDPDALNLRGNLREDQRDYRGALADYEAAVKLTEKEDPGPLNDLAWVLATAPEAQLRNGQRAMQLATKAVELDGGQDWNSVDTLAAACAENKQFEAAVKLEEDAIKKAPAEEQAELKARLELYRAQKPYRLPEK